MSYLCTKDYSPLIQEIIIQETRLSEKKYGVKERSLEEILRTPVTSLFVFRESFYFFKKDSGIDAFFFWKKSS